ncbi:GNAT family N-acetyltransferase [Phycicoccus sp. CMS6Z-2]|nr:GNAT family N-acetyltransferase [Phycicoccus flavus]
MPWPPEPIRTPRLAVRAAEARDRAALVDLYSSPEVFAHLGGPRPRDALDRDWPAVPERRPGSFVVEHEGATIGQVLLRRVPPPARPSTVGAVDLGYLLLPSAWGRGFAGEASAAALGWLEEVLPGERVVLATQVANTASLRVAARLGFTEVERFEAWGAPQWLGAREPGGPAAGAALAHRS